MRICHAPNSPAPPYAEPGLEDNHFGRDLADQRRVRLSKLLLAAGATCQYIYDFGDSWLHDLLLESVLPVKARKRYPVCIGGANSAPPEDVGGIRGYRHCLDALFDLKHEGQA